MIDAAYPEKLIFQKALLLALDKKRNIIIRTRSSNASFLKYISLPEDFQSLINQYAVLYRECTKTLNFVGMIQSGQSSALVLG